MGFFRVGCNTTNTANGKRLTTQQIGSNFGYGKIFDAIPGEIYKICTDCKYKGNLYIHVDNLNCEAIDQLQGNLTVTANNHKMSVSLQIHESKQDDYIIISNISIHPLISEKHKEEMSIDTSHVIVEKTTEQDNDANMEKTTIPISNPTQSILISSTQYPGYGGAATNAYKLFKFIKMQYPHIPCAILFIHDTPFKEHSHANGVFWMAKRNDFRVSKDIERYLMGAPEIVLAKNYVAPVLCRQMWNKSYIVYLVAGIPADDNAYVKLFDDPVKIIERGVTLTAFTHSDLVIYNSLLTKELYCKAFPQHVNKFYQNILDTSSSVLNCKAIGQSLNHTNTRQYDIIICCSDLRRSEKNNKFLIPILSLKRFDKYSKLIIGKQYEHFVSIPNSKCLGLVSHDECIKYLMKSKILLYPSTYDSNPNTVREAIQQRCLVLITNKIGFYERFPTQFVMSTFDTDIWADTLSNILQNYDEVFNTFDFSLFHDESFYDDFKHLLDTLTNNSLDRMNDL